MAAEQTPLEKAKAASGRKDAAETRTWALQHLANDPANVEAATLLARAIDEDGLDEGVAALRRAIAASATPAAQATLLCELLPLAERQERRAHGLPLYHVLDMREFPFHFCKDDIQALKWIWASLSPTDPAVASLAPSVEFVLGNLQASDAALQGIAAASAKKRAPGAYATVRYAPAFYAELNHVDFNKLPQVHLLKSVQFTTPHVLYVGCDMAYFTSYAVPLLRSLAAASPGADAHVHLMLVAGQPEPQIPALDLNLCVTCELIHQGLASPLYYHAMRLVRLYQFLNDRTLWMVDADALVNRNPAALHAKLGGHVGIRVRPGRLQPWNQFSAGLVAATPEAKPYFHLVAAYLTRFVLEGNFSWGMDQMALYGAYQYLEKKPPLTLWGPEEFEVENYGDDAVFWFTAGVHKKDYATGAKLPPPHQTKYWDLFRRYNI